MRYSTSIKQKPTGKEELKPVTNDLKESSHKREDRLKLICSMKSNFRTEEPYSGH